MSNNVDTNKLSMSYTSRDYTTILNELLTTIPNLTNEWQVLNDTDPGVVLLKLISMLGDNLSYNIDVMAKELMPDTVTQRKNASAIYNLVGYKMKWIRSATIQALFFNKSPYRLLIPRFSSYTDSNSTVTYTYFPMDSSKGDLIIEGLSSSSLELVQGTPNLPPYAPQTSNSILTSTYVWYDYYDFNVLPSHIVDRDKIYLSTSNVDQDHIILVDNNKNYWELVDNLKSVGKSGCYFEFKVDEFDRPYLQLIPQWKNYNSSGLFKLFFLESEGSQGTVISDYISRPIELTTNNYKNTSNGLVYASYDNLSITHSSSLGGYDAETADDARETAHNEIGVADTLITISDYQKTLKNYSNVSNVLATDFLNDIYHSNSQSNSLNIYIYLVLKTIMDQTWSETDLEQYTMQLKSYLADLKLAYATVNLNYDGIVYSRWIPSGTIYLKKPIDSDKVQSMLLNIDTYLATTFNLSQVEFNSPIRYLDVVKAIEAADSNIDYVDLDPIEYYHTHTVTVPVDLSYIQWISPSEFSFNLPYRVIASTPDEIYQMQLLISWTNSSNESDIYSIKGIYTSNSILWKLYKNDVEVSSDVSVQFTQIEGLSKATVITVKSSEEYLNSSSLLNMNIEYIPSYSPLDPISESLNLTSYSNTSYDITDSSNYKDISEEFDRLTYPVPISKFMYYIYNSDGTIYRIINYNKDTEGSQSMSIVGGGIPTFSQDNPYSKFITYNNNSYFIYSGIPVLDTSINDTYAYSRILNNSITQNSWWAEYDSTSDTSKMSDIIIVTPATSSGLVNKVITTNAQAGSVGAEILFAPKLQWNGTNPQELQANTLSISTETSTIIPTTYQTYNSSTPVTATYSTNLNLYNNDYMTPDSALEFSTYVENNPVIGVAVPVEIAVQTIVAEDPEDPSPSESEDLTLITLTPEFLSTISDVSLSLYRDDSLVTLVDTSRNLGDRSQFLQLIQDNITADITTNNYYQNEFDSSSYLYKAVQYTENSMYAYDIVAKYYTDTATLEVKASPKTSGEMPESVLVKSVSFSTSKGWKLPTSNYQLATTVVDGVTQLDPTYLDPKNYSGSGDRNYTLPDWSSVSLYTNTTVTDPNLISAEFSNINVGLHHAWGNPYEISGLGGYYYVSSSSLGLDAASPSATYPATYHIDLKPKWEVTASVYFSNYYQNYNSPLPSDLVEITSESLEDTIITVSINSKYPLLAPYLRVNPSDIIDTVTPEFPSDLLPMSTDYYYKEKQGSGYVIKKYTEDTELSTWNVQYNLDLPFYISSLKFDFGSITNSELQWTIGKSDSNLNTNLEVSSSQSQDLKVSEDTVVGTVSASSSGSTIYGSLTSNPSYEVGKMTADEFEMWKSNPLYSINNIVVPPIYTVLIDQDYSDIRTKYLEVLGSNESRVIGHVFYVNSEGNLASSSDDVAYMYYVIYDWTSLWSDVSGIITFDSTIIDIKDDGQSSSYQVITPAIDYLGNILSLDFNLLSIISTLKLVGVSNAVAGFISNSTVKLPNGDTVANIESTSSLLRTGVCNLDKGVIYIVPYNEPEISRLEYSKYGVTIPYYDTIITSDRPTLVISSSSINSDI